MKAILFITIAFLSISCAQNTGQEKVTTITEKTPTFTVVDEHVSGEVTHGLHKIKINDSTTILIYRGVESCTMIQLK